MICLLEPIDLDWVITHGSRIEQFIVSLSIGAAVMLNWSEGDFVQAKKYLEWELKLRSSSSANVAPIQARMGHVSLKLGDTTSAEKYFAQAVANPRSRDRAYINYGLALVAQQKGNLQEAWRLCDLALEQYTRLGIEGELQECKDLAARLLDSKKGKE